MFKKNHQQQQHHVWQNGKVNTFKIFCTNIRQYLGNKNAIKNNISHFRQKKATKTRTKPEEFTGRKENIITQHTL